MSKSVKDEILGRMVDGRIQAKEKLEQSPEAPRRLSSKVRLIDAAPIALDFDSTKFNKKFRNLPKTTADYTRDGFLKSLKRGSIAAIAEWTLRPAHGVIVVSHVTEGWIVSIDGKRFSRKDGMSIDGKRLMLLPMYEKSRYYLIRKLRKKLGLSVIMEAA